MNDNRKNNFDDCMELINSINVNANYKTCENLPFKFTSSDKTTVIEHDEQFKNVDEKEKTCISKIDEIVSNSVIFECNADTGNPGTTSENSADSLKDNKIKQIVVNTNVVIDSFQQVLLKSDCTNDVIENSASDAIEISTGSREALEENMSDCKQENNLLNNFAIFSNVDEKSQLNADVKCQALVDKNARMMTESIDSLDKCTEKEMDSFSNTPLKCLQQATASIDEVENKNSNIINAVEFNSISLQSSEEISQVKSENECSQPKEFEINTRNTFKPEADSLNSLTVFDDKKKNSESRLNMNLTEDLNMHVEPEAVEIVSELVNCLSERDIVTSKVSECENNQVTVSKN